MKERDNIKHASPNANKLIQKTHNLNIDSTLYIMYTDILNQPELIKE